MTSTSPEVFFGATIALAAVATFAVLIRLWILRAKERDISGFMSELVYAICLPLFLATVGLVCKVLHTQMGRMDVINKVGLVEFMQNAELRSFLFYLELLYRIQLWFLKCAYITFLWGIFSRTQNRFVWIIYISFILIVMTFFAVIAVLFVGCQPIKRQWATSSNPAARCPEKDMEQSLRLTMASNLATYGLIYLCALVLFLTSETRGLSRRSKVLLTPLVLLSITPPIAAGLRYLYMKKQPLSAFPLYADLPTFLQILELSISFLPLFLLSFNPSIDSPQEKDYDATLVIPTIPPSGLQRRRRTLSTLGLGTGSGRSNEFYQKRYDLEDPEVVEIGDAVPGVDYKVYEPMTGRTHPLHTPTSMSALDEKHSSSAPRKSSGTFQSLSNSTSHPQPPIPSSTPLSLTSNTTSNYRPPPIPISTPGPTNPESRSSSPRSHRSQSQFEKIRHRIEAEGFRDFTASEARSISRVTNPESVNGNGNGMVPLATGLSPRPRTPTRVVLGQGWRAGMGGFGAQQERERDREGGLPVGGVVGSTVSGSGWSDTSASAVSGRGSR